jgi:hypothetical protein
MSVRNGNLRAFHVAEPSSETAWGDHAAKEFRYYNLVRSVEGT